MLTIEDDAERFDLRDAEPDDSRPDVEEALERLRETLSEAAARDGFRSYHGREGTDDEVDDFRDELVAEAYNSGVTDWDDPQAGEVLNWD